MDKFTRGRHSKKTQVVRNFTRTRSVRNSTPGEKIKLLHISETAHKRTCFLNKYLKNCYSLAMTQNWT